MPRNYIRAIGKKPYSHYPHEKIREALEAVSNGATLRQASEQFGVPRATISRHKNNKNAGKYGRPPVFDEEEERVIAQCLSMAGDWGFPLTKYDIRYIVKSHLDRKGVVEKRFKNNFPGETWIECFLRRNKDTLTTRLAQNIKRSRAAVNEEIINSYFDELEKTIKDIEPALVINYDETNITDDPKRQKVVVRRGCRHPEKIIDGSKSSVSVMFTAAGDGQVLPPYVNYKADHLYNTWTQGGPTGTVYNRTKSGWFTMEIFEDWFKTVIMPYFNKFDKEKPKVLIGDNLASHISKWVIEECIENNVRFVLLPPNSTGFCQPLDVAYFKPLKTKWSEVLTQWKLKNRGVLPKDRFPSELKKCLNRLQENSADNVRAGFRGSGIIPLNRNEILKRLPKMKAADDGNGTLEWVNTLKDFLQDTRTKETGTIRNLKKKRWSLKPGASITNEDLFKDKENAKQGKGKKENLKIKEKMICSSGSTDTDATISIHDTDDDIDLDDYLHDDMDNINEDSSILQEKEFMRCDAPVPTTSKSVLTEVESTNTDKGDFAIVKFMYNEGTKKETAKLFMAQIVDSSDSHLYVKVMRKSSKAPNTFIFPNIDDEQLVCHSSLVRKYVPISVSRGRHIFPSSIRQFKCE